jgi:hypothetical protein
MPGGRPILEGTRTANPAACSSGQNFIFPAIAISVLPIPFSIPETVCNNFDRASMSICNIALAISLRSLSESNAFCNPLCTCVLQPALHRARIDGSGGGGPGTADGDWSRRIAIACRPVRMIDRGPVEAGLRRAALVGGNLVQQGTKVCFGDYKETDHGDFLRRCFWEQLHTSRQNGV